MDSAASDFKRSWKVFGQSLVPFITEWQFKDSQTKEEENARASYK